MSDIQVQRYVQTLKVFIGNTADDLERELREHRAYYADAQWCEARHLKSFSYRPYRRGTNRCQICGCKLDDRKGEA